MSSIGRQRRNGQRSASAGDRPQCYTDSSAWMTVSRRQQAGARADMNASQDRGGRLKVGDTWRTQFSCSASSVDADVAVGSRTVVSVSRVSTFSSR